MKKMFSYRVGVGVEGVCLEYHWITAANKDEARAQAIRSFLDPKKGYDHIEVVRKVRGGELK